MSADSEAPVVQTTSGRVRGTRDRLGGHVFRSIPYAAPPFGARRFQAPAPPEPWDGVRDCAEFGATVPKPGYLAPFDTVLEEPAVAGEDCLTASVWTPDPSADGLPVMVWIHGGAFRNGSSVTQLYDGSAFARDGIVFVSVQYRLGTDGFLALDGAPPNRGLLDQVAALEWVQENVAAFGGDPARVTIFGESAGGMSVAMLVAMPRADGLFHQAIMQSGAGHHALPAGDARKVAVGFAERLGIEPTAEAFGRLEIAELDARQLAFQAEVAQSLDPARWGRVALDFMPFCPHVDGDVLPVAPIEGIRAGRGAQLPMLVGSTTEEWRFFVVPPGVIDAHTDAHVRGWLALAGADPDEILPAYADRHDPIPGDHLAALITDWFFRIPAIRVAEARTASPTFLYEFGWRSTRFDGRMGACHVTDLPFIFDAVDGETTTWLTGETPPQALADAAHGAWVEFASTGDPGWEPYTPATRATRTFAAGGTGADVATVHDPRPEQRAAWERVRP